MALKVEFVLFQPRDIELLARRSTLELASDVFFVIADNSNLC